jgi:hypothetical protein
MVAQTQTVMVFKILMIAVQTILVLLSLRAALTLMVMVFPTTKTNVQMLRAYQHWPDVQMLMAMASLMLMTIALVQLAQEAIEVAHGQTLTEILF